MEQKKIFWIVIAVSVFLLVIFGTAIILYWPSRSTGTSLQQAAVLPPANGTIGSGGSSANQIDPDAWVREPGTTPGLDANATPPTGINLTIVNGDNTGANYGIVDVNGLTKAPAPVETADAVKTAVDSSGQSGLTTVTSKAGATDSGAVISKTTTVKTEMTVQTAAKPAAAKAAAPTVKPVPQKTVAVTEYWIQTGSFSNRINAEKARDTLTARYLKAEIFTREVSGKTAYRVRVGPYKSKNEADYWLGTVKEIPDFSGSYVSEVKTKK